MCKEDSFGLDNFYSNLLKEAESKPKHTNNYMKSCYLTMSACSFDDA